MGQNSVKYTQSYISATWTRTDVNLSTNLADEVVGLNGAVGSRLPSGFIYASKQPGSGSTFHSYLRTDISSYHMPMVVSVSPKQSGALYWLTSWSGSGTASPGNYGHYIVLREWDDYWDNTRNPAIFYNDGSGGYGGATGIYGDPAFDIWYMINLYNPNHAAGWVIW